MPWPITTERSKNGRLAVGGMTAVDLVARFDSPLYVFDEATLRTSARRFLTAFRSVHPRSRVVYAGKAYLSPSLMGILREEGLGLEIVSGGELFAGRAAGVPAAEMTFHGNNKSEAELREAVVAGVGLIAIDNDWEIELLSRVIQKSDRPQRVLIRLNPGVEVDTHHKMLTGAIDSKFGFPVATGDAAAAVERVLGQQGLAIAGYHAHVGSQVFDPDVVGTTIRAMVAFSAEMRDRHGVMPEVLSPGGGFGVADDARDDGRLVEDWAAKAATVLRSECQRFNLPLPELVVEPGRAMVGPAGVALYRVGARKEIRGVRTYISVDGGMADNPRPTLYGATYTAALANRESSGHLERVTIAGKYCESGDVLIDEIDLPRLTPGDLLAVPMAGAYCLAMASNYNLAPRPAVVLVNNGDVRLIRRRETYDDLLRLESVPPEVRSDVGLGRAGS